MLGSCIGVFLKRVLRIFWWYVFYNILIIGLWMLKIVFESLISHIFHKYINVKEGGGIGKENTPIWSILKKHFKTRDIRTSKSTYLKTHKQVFSLLLQNITKHLKTNLLCIASKKNLRGSIFNIRLSVLKDNWNILLRFLF